MRLLLVEDNAKIVHAIRYIIETEFRETIRHTLRVATVREGIAALAAFRPDILLFDVALPDGEGFELLNAQSREDFLISVCMSALPPKDLIKKNFAIRRFPRFAQTFRRRRTERRAPRGDG